MKKRTILLLTFSLLLVLAFVQVTLVSAAEEAQCEGEDCPYVPPDDYVCDDPEGCPAEPEPEPDPPPVYCPEGVCFEEPEEVVDECEFGNPGNAKCVGRAGEKEDVEGVQFWVDSGEDANGHDPGTHGRSNPKHHPDGHPSE